MKRRPQLTFYFDEGLGIPKRTCHEFGPLIAWTRHVVAPKVGTGLGLAIAKEIIKQQRIYSGQEEWKKVLLSRLSYHMIKRCYPDDGWTSRMNKKLMDEKGFKYSILASGSSGQLFYLETPKKKIYRRRLVRGRKLQVCF